MNKILFLILFLTGCANSQINPIPVPYKGIVSKYNASIIADDACSDAKNMYFDKTGGVSKRLGSVNFDNSVPVMADILGEYEFVKSDGNRYMLKVVGSSLQYTSGDGNWTTLISTLNANYEPDFATFLDQCWISNGIDDVYYFDGTVLVSSPTVPKFRYLEVYQNRLWGANVNGDTNKIGHASLSLMNANSAFSFDYVNKNDGDYITGLKSYNGVLYVFKNKAIHACIWKYALNIDEDSYIIRQISNGYGTPYDRTIQEYQKSLVFHDGRNVVQMIATTEGEAQINVVSRQIDDRFYNIPQLKNYKTTLTETTSSDFGKGSGINIDTTTISGSVANKADVLTINQINTSSTSWSGNLATEYYQSFRSSYTAPISTVSVYLHGLTLNANVVLRLYDYNKIELCRYADTYVGNSSDRWFNFNVSTQNITLIADSTYYITLQTFSGSGNIFWYTYNAIIPPYTTPYTRGTQGTISGTTWTDSSPAKDSVFKIYQSYYQPYSQYQSKVYDLTGMLSWNVFNSITSKPTGTNINWFVSCATASVLCNSSNLTPVTEYNIVNSTIIPFIMFFASMTSNGIDQTPRIDEVSVQYISIITKSMTSAVFNDYYYIGITTAGVNYNGIVYCANKDWIWTSLEGWYPRCFVNYNGDLYCGDSRSTGYTHRLEVDGIYHDYNNGYDSYLTTKNFSFQKLDTDKIFDKLYLNFNNGGINSNVLAQVNFDTSDVWVTSQTFNLSDTSKKFYNKKMPIKLSTGNRGKYIKLKLSNSTTNQYWEFHGGNVYYTDTQAQ